MSRSDIEPLLDAARACIELPATLDMTARIAAENLVYGVAKTLAAVRTVDPRATLRYRSSPDLTITRTASRWRYGFAYGGVLELAADEAIVLPELRPNACGTLVGVLNDPLDMATLVRRASTARDACAETVWDYSRRNHFVNLYRRRGSAAGGAGEVFVIHGCPASIRTDSATGPGLYANKSAHWQQRLHTVPTPLGPVHLLVGGDAGLFWDNYQRCETISKQHRHDTARQIFGDFTTLHNGTHAGMHGLGLYYQGCHLVHPGDEEERYPVLTRPGEPLYLVTAYPVTSPASGSREPYAILPHGTGYRLTGFDSLEVGTSDAGDHPLFILRNGSGCAVYGDLSSVPFDYRESDLVLTWQRRGDLRIRETLDMVATVKL